MTKIAVDRSTKYVKAVRVVLKELGHATNAEIAAQVREEFPNVSPTTIHRVTSRLFAHGEIGLAPSKDNNSMRFDYNSAPHDHFVCISCEMIRDAAIGKEARENLERSIGLDCSISGSITISGVCKKCKAS